MNQKAVRALNSEAKVVLACKAANLGLENVCDSTRCAVVPFKSAFFKGNHVKLHRVDQAKQEDTTDCRSLQNRRTKNDLLQQKHKKKIKERINLHSRFHTHDLPFSCVPHRDTCQIYKIFFSVYKH